MLPHNTVPITAEEADWLSDNLIFIPHWQLDLTVPAPYWEQQCFRFSTLQGYLIGLNSIQFRIAAHDYRHYFGEVVDLAKYSTKVEDNRVVIIYLGVSADYIQVDTKRYELTIYGSGKMILHILADEELCKQELIKHFTAIAAKDLPNYNLKFIFS
jgi:hypothetical protein